MKNLIKLKNQNKNTGFKLKKKNMRSKMKMRKK